MEAKTTNPTTIPAKCETLSYDGYTLQWEDDFNGPELNREDWNVELHEAGWVNHELQAYIDSPPDHLHPKQQPGAETGGKEKSRRDGVVYLRAGQHPAQARFPVRHF